MAFGEFLTHYFQQYIYWLAVIKNEQAIEKKTQKFSESYLQGSNTFFDIIIILLIRTLNKTSKFMRRIAILLFVFLSAVFYAQAQTDKVYFLNGDVLEVEIKKIGADQVEYVFPNETFSNAVNKSELEKIQFKSGRVQNFNKKKEAPKSLKRAIVKNKVAVLPIPFVKQGSSGIDSEQKARLAQSKMYSFLTKNLGKIHPRTVQTPRETNSLLRQAGVKITDLDQMSISELESYLGVEYIITGRIEYNLKVSSTSVETGGAKVKDNKVSGATVNTSSQNTEYNYTVYIDLYQNADNIYSKNRQPFFKYESSWADSFEYIIKRMPIYNR